AGFAQPAYIRIKPIGGKVVRLVNSGDWSTASNWSDENGNPGVPGPNDLAVITSATANISQNVTASFLSLTSGSIVGSGGSLTIGRMFTVAGGELNNVNLTVDSGARMIVVSDNPIPTSGSVTNNGIIRITGRGGFVPVRNGAKGSRSIAAPNGFFDGVAALFKNAGEFFIALPKRIASALTPPPAPPPIPEKRGVYAAKFENSGQLLSENGLGIINQDNAGLINQDGASIISTDGASLINQDGASLINQDGASAISHDGSSLINQDGASRPALFAGSAAAATSAGFIQTGGETDLTRITIESSVTLNGGSLTGSGVIGGSLTNNSGFISPGHSAGTISVTGDFYQAGAGTLIVENGGLGSGQADQLQVAGTATLGGTLHVRAIGNYVANPADTFSPLSYAAVNGSFASAGGNASLTLNANGALVSINPAAPPPQSGQPLNIATRMRVLTNDKVLIGGFIVSGPSGSTKKVLIRGLGPTLTDRGVSGVLPDPFLDLYLPDGSVISNDNWDQAPNKGEIPQGFTPKATESVIIATLSPGAYTVIESGAHNEIGVGLTEIYDLDPSSAAQLGNISTRGFVQTGDNVMIGGFIVGGNEPTQVLIRASGPSLKSPPNNLSGVLEDPTLELVDANGNSLTNDDWRETQQNAIIATTIPPLDNHEPAILATLTPGGYTAVVRGKNDTTGIAVVEVYKIK
ncbi:MAG TPA: hypothetical protein VF511_06850, partial [Chthoniobacterales bacterium]